MKKLFVPVALVAAFSVSTVQGGMTVTLLDNTSKYSYGVGGEFRGVANSELFAATGNLSGYSPLTKGIVSSSDSGSLGYKSALNGLAYFQTFCIEYNEEFYPGTTYGVGISQKAMYGNQGVSGDPLSIGTAWLYSRFAAGTLAGYTYTYGSGRTSSAGALQKAIWWLENEPNGVRTSFIDTAENALYGAHGIVQDALIKGDANGAFNVRALNLGAPGAVQDQLVIVPETSTCVFASLLVIPLCAQLLRKRLVG